MWVVSSEVGIVCCAIGIGEMVRGRRCGRWSALYLGDLGDLGLSDAILLLACLLPGFKVLPHDDSIQHWI